MHNQVDHYRAWSYVSENRFKSFYWQISEALSLGPSSIIEIGIGRLSVFTIDIDERLGPDVVSSIERLPIRSGSIDVALCCQVLEHLEYSLLEHSISQLARIVRKGIVISVPNAFPYYDVRFALPLVGNRSFAISRTFGPKPNIMNMNPSHRWEIGYRGIKVKDIITILERSRLNVVRHYRVKDNPYHHFFVARKRT